MLRVVHRFFFSLHCLISSSSSLRFFVVRCHVIIRCRSSSSSSSVIDVHLRFRTSSLHDSLSHDIILCHCHSLLSRFATYDIIVHRCSVSSCIVTCRPSSLCVFVVCRLALAWLVITMSPQHPYMVAEKNGKSTPMYNTHHDL